MKAIGTVSFYQWCFAPLRGNAIDKTCHFRFWVAKQSNREACSRRSLCCCPRLVWCAVAIIAVRAHMVVGGIGEFFHSLIQFLFRPEFVQIGAFILQSVEVSLHRRIVVWISGFAHALDYMGRFAGLCERF